MIANFITKERIPFYIEMTEKEYELNVEKGIIKGNEIKLGSSLIPIVISTRSPHQTFENMEGGE